MYCNILMYISSVNTWASCDSPLAQLVKELDLCLFLCVIRRQWDRLPAEPINNFSPYNTVLFFNRPESGYPHIRFSVVTNWKYH